MTIPGYWQNEEDPAYTFDWKDRNGNLFDFSSGQTWRVDLYDASGVSVYNQTTGVTGSAISPNVTVVWAAGWNASITPGIYRIKVTDTSSSRQKSWPPPGTPDAQIEIKAALT